jgi:uncharacterized protein YdeI (YjbR/CyaY-like superfamily)
MEKVPSDLQKVLTANTEAHALWKDLTPIARRDFMSWIASAKQPETRKRRIESIPSRLLSGKRRPCCYAIVPMNFYKALGGTPKAKAQWSTLTPDERRDFVDWVGEAKGSDEKRLRVEKACLMLASGKRCP